MMFSRRVKAKPGGIEGQIFLSIEKSLHFARVFEKKYQKS